MGEGKQGVRKNLHIIVGFILMVLIIVGLVVQYIISGDQFEKKTKGDEIPELTAKPEIDRLRRELEEQRKEAERKRKELERKQGELGSREARLLSESERLRLERERLERERALREAAELAAAKREEAEEAARASKLEAIGSEYTSEQHSASYNAASEQNYTAIHRRDAELREKQAMSDISGMSDFKELLNDQKNDPVEHRGLVDHNLDWQSKQTATGEYILGIRKALGRPVLQEGTIIPAILLSGINSDLPGTILARVTQDVYDSVEGNTMFFPKGTRLVGTYNTAVMGGQNRIMVAFTRMFLPDGRTINIDGMAGAGNQGIAGLSADVNTHFMAMMGRSLLIAGISALFEAGVNSVSGDSYSGSGDYYNSPGQRSGAGEIMVNAADKATKHYDNIPPTLEVPPGTPFMVIVNKDIVL